MKVLEKFGDKELHFYTGELHDLIIIQGYQWGKPSVLIKYKKNNKFGDSFIELNGGSGSSNGSKVTFNLTNVYEQYIQDVILYTMDDKAFISSSTFDFEVMNRVDSLDLSNIDLLELPKRRVVYYSRKFKGENRFIIIDADEFDHSLPRNFYIGTYFNYKRLDIIDQVNYRDGGTTYITTNEGVFFSPTPFNKELKSTWTDKDEKEFELEKINEDYIPHDYTLMLEALNIKDVRKK